MNTGYIELLENRNELAADSFSQACAVKAAVTEQPKLGGECTSFHAFAAFVSRDVKKATRLARIAKANQNTKRGDVVADLVLGTEPLLRKRPQEAMRNLGQAAQSVLSQPTEIDPYLANWVAVALETLGEMELSNGRNRDGSRALLDSLAVFSAVVGRTSTEMIPYLYKVGLKLMVADQPENKEVAKWMIEVAALDPDPERAKALHYAAVSNLDLGNYEDDVTIALFSRLAYVQRTFGPASIDAAEVLASLGERAEKDAQYALGRKFLHKALHIVATATDRESKAVKDLQEKVDRLLSRSSNRENFLSESKRKITSSKDAATERMVASRIASNESLISIKDTALSSAHSFSVDDAIDVLSRAHDTLLSPIRRHGDAPVEEIRLRHRLASELLDRAMELKLKSGAIDQSFIALLRSKSRILEESDGLQPAIDFLESHLTFIKTTRNPTILALALSNYANLFSLALPNYSFGENATRRSLRVWDARSADMIALSEGKLDRASAQTIRNVLLEFADANVKQRRLSAAQRNWKQVAAIERQFRLNRDERPSYLHAGSLQERNRTKLADDRERQRLRKLLIQAKSDFERSEVAQSAITAFDLASADAAEFAEIAFDLEIKDLAGRMDKFVLSPVEQIADRQKFLDSSIDRYLTGVIGSGDELESRSKRLAKSIEMFQWTYSGQAASALLRASVRAQANRGLAVDATKFDAAYVQWRQALADAISIASDPDPARALPPQLVDTMASAYHAAEEIGVRLRKEPGYSGSVESKNVPLSAIQAVLDPKEALIQYLYRNEYSFFALVITKTYADVFDLHAYQRARSPLHRPDMSVEQGALAVIRNIRSKAIDFDHAAARSLYEHAFRPLEDALNGISRLVIIPSGPLWDVPLAAILVPRDGKDSWLVERFVLRTALSIGSFVALRSQPDSPPEASPFIGFADPLMRNSDAACAYSAWGYRRTRGSGFCPIPESRGHVMALANVFRWDTPEAIVTGAEFTIHKIIERLRQPFQVVGFSTHALTSEEARSVLGSPHPALLVTPSQTDATLNEWLTTAQIEQLLSIPTDLVVLSGCNTMGAEAEGGETLSGLARAFFEAGARGVMASNWHIDPFSTKEVLERLRGSSRDVPTSLQVSMASLARTELHPRYWAIFSYIGR
ncbi:CHAT domain-containing protein [Bradyrhizobium sp. USDA 3397]